MELVNEYLSPDSSSYPCPLSLKPPRNMSVAGNVCTTSSIEEYLTCKIFPSLLPSLKETLDEAIREKCFERKSTKCNLVESLTKHLCKNNPNQDQTIPFDEIPFVKHIKETRPCYPVPKYLELSEFDAILIIQSFWRGFMVRSEDQIKELRCWQKEWRIINEEKRQQMVAENIDMENIAIMEAIPGQTVTNLPNTIINIGVKDLCCPATVTNSGVTPD